MKQEKELAYPLHSALRRMGERAATLSAAPGFHEGSKESDGSPNESVTAMLNSAF